MYWYVGSAGALTGGLSDECAGGHGSFELPVLNWRYSHCNHLLRICDMLLLYPLVKISVVFIATWRCSCQHPPLL